MPIFSAFPKIQKIFLEIKFCVQLSPSENKSPLSTVFYSFDDQGCHSQCKYGREHVAHEIDHVVVHPADTA